MTDELKQELMAAVSKEEIRAAMREGMRDFLNEQYAKIGRWTLGALGALLVASVIYLLQHFTTYGK